MMRGGSLTGLGAGTHSPSLCQIHVQGKQDAHFVIVESANRVHYVQNFKCGEDFLFTETSTGENGCKDEIYCNVNAMGSESDSLMRVELDLKDLASLRILHRVQKETLDVTPWTALEVLDAPRDTQWATALYTTRSGLDIYISIRVVHEDTPPAVRNARPANNRRSFPRQPPGASSSGGAPASGARPFEIACPRCYQTRTLIDTFGCGHSYNCERCSPQMKESGCRACYTAKTSPPTGGTAAASGGRFSSGMSSSDPLPEACVSCWGAGPLIDTFGCGHSYNCEKCSTRMKKSGAVCRACYTAKTSPPTGGTAAASGGRFSSGSGSGAAAGGSSSSSRPAASRAEEEKLFCVVCMDKTPNRVCDPCGHRIYCRDCAGIMEASDAPCAICRKKVTEYREA